MSRLVAMALALPLIAAPALAAGALVDHDGDGRISRTEYRTAIRDIAAAADRNGDGMIDASEYAFTPADLALFDNDGDGTVSAVAVQEFIDGMDIAFDVIDADMDGYLSPAELSLANGRYGIMAPLAMIDQAASEKPRPASKG